MSLVNLALHAQKVSCVGQRQSPEGNTKHGALVLHAGSPAAFDRQDTTDCALRTGSPPRWGRSWVEASLLRGVIASVASQVARVGDFTSSSHGPCTNSQDHTRSGGIRPGHA